MTRNLTFGIVYRYPENAKGITIPVTLISPNGTYRAAAKADTGADVCLFSNDAGLQLGLDVERGIPKTLVTPGGTEIESCGIELLKRRIRIQTQLNLSGYGRRSSTISFLRRPFARQKCWVSFNMKAMTTN